MSVVIVNPSSAGGSTGEAWPQIASDLRSQFGAFQDRVHKHRGDAAALAQLKRRAKARNSSSPAAAMALFPKSQTGFSRPVKMLNSASCPAALAAISDERSKFLHVVVMLREFFALAARVRIDVGRVSYIDHNGAEATRYFVGVASCGMSTKVIERVKERTDGSGKLQVLGGRSPALADKLRCATSRCVSWSNSTIRTSASRRLESLHRKCALLWRRDEDRSRCETD